MKEIAIVILNWNGKSYLEKFLPTLIQNSSDAEIYIADNASTDDSVSYIKTHFPSVHIVQNEQNGGFAKGYNDALKHIQSTYYLLINSDVEVSPNWLDPLYDTIIKENVAGVQPKICAYNQKKHFEHAGAAGGFIDRNYFPFCRGRIMSTCEEDSGQYDGISQVFWTSGACMLIKTDAFWEVGGFDEDFFAHMEEIDLCWRLKQQNYAFYINPNSIVYHVGGGTLNYESPQKVYLNFRNSLYMITKNHQGYLFPKLFYRMILDGIAAFQFLAKGKFSFFIAIIKSHFSFYVSFRKMYTKRNELRQKRGKYNKIGFYKGSILWAFYVKGIKEFSKLNMRLFH